MSFTLPRGLFALAAVMLAVSLVALPLSRAAEDDPKSEAPSKDKEKEEDAPDAAALLKEIQNARRDVRAVRREMKLAKQDKPSDEQRKTIKQAMDKIAKASESLADAQADEQQASAARLIHVTSLRDAAELDPEGFGKTYEAALADLAEKQPDSPLVAEQTIKRFEKEVLSGDKVTKEAVDKLVAFAKNAPENSFGILLFIKVANRYLIAGQKDQAVAVYQKGIEAYEKNPNVEYLRESLKQVEQHVGKPMDVQGPALGGGKVDLAALKGKVVLIDFWATWCGPCVEEMPNLKEAYTKHHDAGFEVIGVSADQERKDLEEFVDKNEIPWPQVIYLDKEGKVEPNKVIEQHNINSFPSTFLIGRDGKVLAVGLRGEELIKSVGAALKGK